MGDIDPGFQHDAHGQKIYFFWLSAGAKNLMCGIAEMTRKAFCHLAPAGIAGAQKENRFAGIAV